MLLEIPLYKDCTVIVYMPNHFLVHMAQCTSGKMLPKTCVHFKIQRNFQIHTNIICL